ncbi:MULTISPECIES: LysR family transcriptional regulator [unclassified Motilimonas]|uniref:LysR family transcriptional regulator n=1 Tax=unclassified Motilimonas TaxID=2643697 RepID=UPI001E56A052|nr:MULTISPECIES: LysR family transcriptional regulator [unclassified Motilimonas]MCE0555954.1 LysR family transcriptional regulator [Motilimonas sp. E26]MDO6527882.1 LysR family transcriptional regulator [Motilimonas sp. 1_MG-2023]
MLALARFLPVFLTVCETLNFSKAARKMGVTPAAVSKSIGNLEQQLAQRLFHRTTHALSLTDEGQRFYQQVAPLLEQLDSVLTQHSPAQMHPNGLLRVSVPYGFGRQHLLPLIAGFCRAYPDVQLDLRFEDKVVDMIKEGIDVAIGNSLPSDSTMIARRLCPLSLVAVASPAFITKHGMPAHPSELNTLARVCYRSPTTYRIVPWQFNTPDNKLIVIHGDPALSVTNIELTSKLALEGLGVTLLSRWLVQDELQSGALVEVLADFPATGTPIMIYYASKQHQPSKVRVFIDYVTEHLVVDN